MNLALWKENPENSTSISQNLSVLLCPSEVKPEVSTHDYGLSGVTSYGVNQGDWFVWGGFNGPQNRNAFGMNRSRRIAEFTDGTSQTLLAAEVKTYQPASNCQTIPLPSVNNPNNIPSPYATPIRSRLNTTMALASPRTSSSFTPSGPTATPTPPALPRPGPRTSKSWASRCTRHGPRLERPQRGARRSHLCSDQFPQLPSWRRELHSWAMAPSSSSRAASTAWSGGDWGRSPAVR